MFCLFLWFKISFLCNLHQKCLFSSIIKNGRKQISITINGDNFNNDVSDFVEAPVITNRPPSRVAVAQGSTLSLCCEASGSPQPKVLWSRVYQSSDSTMAFQERGCLEINPVKYNSDGDYICQAKNRFGLAETTTSVIVNTRGV